MGQNSGYRPARLPNSCVLQRVNGGQVPPCDIAARTTRISFRSWFSLETAVRTLIPEFTVQLPDVSPSCFTPSGWALLSDLLTRSIKRRAKGICSEARERSL